MKQDKISRLIREGLTPQRLELASLSGGLISLYAEFGLHAKYGGFLVKRWLPSGSKPQEQID